MTATVESTENRSAHSIKVNKDKIRRPESQYGVSILVVPHA